MTNVVRPKFSDPYERRYAVELELQRMFAKALRLESRNQLIDGLIADGATFQELEVALAFFDAGKSDPASLQAYFDAMWAVRH